MSREKIFRGKRCDNKEWVEGFYVCLNGKEHRIYSGFAETDCGDYYPDFYSVDPETVGQLVSDVSDKNGKNIFEGDIVRFKTRFCYFSEPFYVKWNEISLRYLATLPDGVRSYPMDSCWEYEVIGNIHDTPSLIGDETYETD